MKNIALFLLILFSDVLFGQNKLFVYEYKFITDSNTNQVEKQIMVLNIHENKSEFYNLDNYQSDSTLLADSKKGVFSMPPDKEMIRERINKSQNSKTVEYITILSNTKYFVKQNVDLKWHLSPETDHILGYEVQKATVEFGGRNWVAWFSKDIQIHDGPYKFFGLPGLILKIEDTTKSHIFEIKGVKNSTANFQYPELGNYQKVNITYPQFVKAYKNYRKNPMADSVGLFPDQTYSNGKFVRGEEIFKEYEKAALKRIAKDNNIIEIDWLK
ncbi:GLPGLI family protein [Chryseobacterium indoltheticum]|uniref:GLPGLI family protein n=1 Tax=Chryseobacterium indoltheticum TaxID=254 RepID=A0A381FIA3_9FLAO|nr:GLPGLI family protein [Chryseobacterium indoltheticum]SUX46279.1 GLPGLI family protein [Chryseobacterium indoltheticum]